MNLLVLSLKLFVEANPLLLFIFHGVEQFSRLF